MTVQTAANGGDLVIYTTEDGKASIDVRLDGDTVWLSQAQMVELFERDLSVISRHISNALKEEEVDAETSLQNLQTTLTGRPTTFYNLDVIISVGYRVKSLRGVQFRRWATTVLKDHLVKGYSVNQRRMEQLHQALEIIARSNAPEIAGVANVLKLYADGLTLLDNYDHRTVSTPAGHPGGWALNLDEAREFITSMRFAEDSDLFGVEKDGSFPSSIATIYQTFDGQELYPTVESKAANLLYLVTKNHSFVDGNKRIAAGLFVHFLERSGRLLREDGTPIIDNAALAGLTLMIALSKPPEKDIMCNLVMNALTWEHESSTNK
ncbi:MAG: virulence protein RhuM/Fic/DOC family protein [Propionibacteriaceae bacterium]|nr:virulence protein RhuM/Fic/DOC family protein [Propionibacteriaceae bacterium]